MHLGEAYPLAEIRCCYWVPRGKSFVKKILQRCLICRKFNSRLYSYPYSQNLPNVKVNNKIAFTGPESIIITHYIAKVFMIRIHWKMIIVYLSAKLFYTHVHPQEVSFQNQCPMQVRKILYMVLGFTKFIARRGCPGELDR